MCLNGARSAASSYMITKYGDFFFFSSRYQKVTKVLFFFPLFVHFLRKSGEASFRVTRKCQVGTRRDAPLRQPGGSGAPTTIHYGDKNLWKLKRFDEKNFHSEKLEFKLDNHLYFVIKSGDGWIWWAILNILNEEAIYFATSILR